ncbi:MAG: hypothetical protein ACFBSD_13335 [Paracoccaceae bacterium]
MSDPSRRPQVVRRHLTLALAGLLLGVAAPAAGDPSVPYTEDDRGAAAAFRSLDPIFASSLRQLAFTDGRRIAVGGPGATHRFWELALYAGWLSMGEPTLGDPAGATMYRLTELGAQRIRDLSR